MLHRLSLASQTCQIMVINEKGHLNLAVLATPVTSFSAVITPPVAKVSSIPPAAMAAAKVTDIRPGKRTKWDKVDDRSGLPPLDAVAVARERAAAIGGGGSLRSTGTVSLNCKYNPSI